MEWHLMGEQLLASTDRNTAQYDGGLQGRFYVGVEGQVPPPPPQIHLLPSDSKASWPFWHDFWGPQMLQNPSFFRSLQHSPDL